MPRVCDENDVNIRLFFCIYSGFETYMYYYTLLQDIRSYFVPVATSQKRNSEPVSKPQKRRVISSDEDEEKSKSSAKRTKVCHVICMYIMHYFIYYNCLYYFFLLLVIQNYD